MFTRFLRVKGRLIQARITTIRDAGASAVEYGLMVAAIAAVIVGVIFGLGNIVKNTFSQTEQCITLQANGPNCAP